jgi:hypothetical protein
MAVAFDAKMTGGNGVGGTYAEGASAIALSGMTAGVSATCLVVTIHWVSAVTSPSCTWAAQTMTLAGPATSTVETAIFWVTNPTTGAQNITPTWTGGGTAYVSAVSFTGTDTTTAVKAADNITATAVEQIAVTSGLNDATVAAYTNDGTPPATNFNSIFVGSDLSQNGAASYQLGGSSNTHTFGSGGGNRALVGVHVVAPAVSTTPWGWNQPFSQPNNDSIGIIAN